MYFIQFSTFPHYFLSSNLDNFKTFPLKPNTISDLSRWMVIGGKAWRKKDVSFSKLWNTSEFFQTMMANIKGPMQRI